MRRIVPLFVTLILHPVIAWSAVDSDGDGVTDYREQKDGTDPNDAVSYNGLSRELVAHYPLNGNASDESGYQNNGVPNGCVPAPDRLNRPSSAYFFDGNDFIQIPNSASLSLGQSSITVAVWIRTPASNSRFNFIYSDDSDSLRPGFELSLHESGSAYYEISSSGQIMAQGTGAKRIRDGGWHHVVVTFDRGGTVRLFVDGMLDFTGGLGAQNGNVSNSVDSRIGMSPSGGGGFSGEIDEVRIYRRALSVDEVFQLYQTDTGAVSLASGTTSFEVIRGSFTWQQAKADAEARGGRLAVFPSAEMYDRVIARVRQSFSGNVWLGLTDEAQEGVWRWIDGTSLTYSRWHGGEPNNSGGVEDYAHLTEGSGTTWNDNAASALLPYLLESHPLSLLDLPVVEQGSPWRIDEMVSHDGVSSAKAQSTDGQSTYREYAITGPAVVDFWWKVSSEQGFDFFSYSVNGVVQEAISGEIDWTYRTLTLPEGTHQIRWTYAKDATSANYDDAGYLDEFAVLPAEARLEVRQGSAVLSGEAAVNFGDPALAASAPTRTFTFTNRGTVALEFSVQLSGDGAFFLTDADSGEMPIYLGRGESIDLGVTMSTGTAGSKAGLMTVTAPNSIAVPPIISLGGYVRGAKLELAHGSSPVTNGQAAAVEFPGLAPTQVEFIVRNTGVAPLNIEDVSVSGDFTVVTAPPPTINAGASAIFRITSIDAGPGRLDGMVSIASNDPDVPDFLFPVSAQSLVGAGGVATETTGTNGSAGWGLAVVTLPDGSTGSAAKTGATTHNGESVLRSNFIGPGLLTWSWKVSAQENFDWLLCEVNGREVAGISTKNADWQSQAVQITDDCIVRWVYRKDASNVSGEDAGYLADVEFQPWSGPREGFHAWAQNHGHADPLQRLPGSGLPAVFSWLGGFDPLGGPVSGHYVPTVEGGRLTYRFPFDTGADGAALVEHSTDLLNWSSRGLSQRVLPGDGAQLVMEVAAPRGSRGYLRLRSEAIQTAPFPVSLGVDNDYALFAGTANTITRLLHQNSAIWDRQQSVSVRLEFGETMIYVLAMDGGGNAGMWGSIADLPVVEMEGVQVSSDIRGWLSSYSDESVEAATFNASLGDVRSAMANVTWRTALASNLPGASQQPSRQYVFGVRTAVLFRIPTSAFGF